MAEPMNIEALIEEARQSLNLSFQEEIDGDTNPLAQRQLQAAQALVSATLALVLVGRDAPD